MKHLLPLKYVDTIARTGSIRKAAEALAITSTALNRRILSIEDELGVQLFERLPRGVRLNTAGELFVHHIRNQISDLERVKSQIADLAGARRGNVTIACGQALLPFFMPEQISRYRQNHPGVTFNTRICDRVGADQFLSEYQADVAIVFEPLRVQNFQPLTIVEQPIHAVMSKDHSLANEDKIRLSQLNNQPLALPTRANGVRHLLDNAAMRRDIQLSYTIESDSFDFLRNYIMQENCISFQIPIGLPVSDQENTFVSIPVDQRDIPPGELYVGQLRNRTLSVAAALFVSNLVKDLETRFHS